MFGRQSKEEQEIEKLIMAPNTPQEAKLTTDRTEESSLVNTIEKISRIISPYFIALVGLSLYDKNFLIGTSLITIGILSLLKVTPEDIGKFINWLKELLGFSDSSTM